MDTPAERIVIPPDLNVRELTEKLQAHMADLNRQTIRSVIKKMRGPIQQARKKGMTYIELANWLEKQGVRCSATTIKIYLSRLKRKTAKKPTKPGNRPVELPKPRYPSAPRGFNIINDEEL